MPWKDFTVDFTDNPLISGRRKMKSDISPLYQYGIHSFVWQKQSCGEGAVRHIS